MKCQYNKGEGAKCTEKASIQGFVFLDKETHGPFSVKVSLCVKHAAMIWGIKNVSPIVTDICAKRE